MSTNPSSIGFYAKLDFSVFCACYDIAETPHQEANEVNSIIVQINPASDSNSLNVLQNLNCDTKNNNEEDKSLLEGKYL